MLCMLAVTESPGLFAGRNGEERRERFGPRRGKAPLEAEFLNEFRQLSPCAGASALTWSPVNKNLFFR
jgi:hypothetical protein